MKRVSISSKRQLLLISMIFIIPFLTFLFIYNVCTVNVLNAKIAQSNRGRVEQFREMLEDDLRSTERFMSNLVANDLGFQQLQYKRTELEAHLATYDILQKYKDMMEVKSIVAGFFIYTPVNGLYRQVYRPGVTINEQEDINRYLRSLVDSGEEIRSPGWFPAIIGDSSYLLRVLESNNTYSICLVDFELVKKPGDFADESTGNSGFLFYTTAAGQPAVSPEQSGVESGVQPLSHAEEVREQAIELRAECGDYYLTGKNPQYFVVQSHSDYLKINVVYAMQYFGLLTSMDPWQLSMLIASAVFLVLIFVCFWMMKRTFFSPLNRLIDTMNAIRSGDLDAQMSTETRIEEFRQVGDTFNSMVEEIKRLKIVAYEQKLEIQQAELQYLQIQIRPHFFLNCLKNLYGLAQARQFQKMQDMILALSDYLRTMFQNQSLQISLSTELHHVDTYILLQQMSLSSPPVYVADTDASLKDFPIPPLSILSFVENSVKHGASAEHRLRIHVKIRRLLNEDGEYVNVTILDNGPGYSPEMLELLNGGDVAAIAREHVGIANVRRRFALLYGERCMFLFSSSNGASVEIFIPVSDVPGDSPEA